jgi:hypothetical protein
MLKIVRSVLGASLAVLYGCSTVCAATVSGQSGAVLISEGAGFVPLKGTAELAPGARVMVNPGQVATITYSDTCAVKVDSGRVWTIQAAAPCAKGTGVVDFTGRMNDGVVSVPTEPEEAPGMSGSTMLLIGAAAVGGGLLIACVADWCRSSKSSSP